MNGLKIWNKLKNFSKEDYIKILTMISLVVVLSPLFLYPLPQNVFNGDVTLHYKLTGLIDDDINFVSYENYPKLYQFLNLYLVYLLNFPIGHAMYLLTIVSVLLLPYVTYKVGLELTKNKDIAILSALFSVITIFYNSIFVGSAPVPQTMGLMLIPAIFYLYLKNHSIYAGLLLGFHMLLHGSWPISILLMLLYTFLDFYKTRKIQRIRDTFIILIIGFLISLPVNLYIKMNLFHDTIISTVRNSLVYITSMIPLIWFPLIITPILIPFLILYGIWKLYKGKKLKETNYLFILLSFILLIIATQLYFLDIKGTVLGITYIPARIVPFLLLPMSLLSAFAVNSLFKNKYKLVAFLVLLMVLSLPQYVSWYEKTTTSLDDNDISVINFLSEQDYGEVFYNPINYNSNEYFIIDMSIQDMLDRSTSFLILSGERNNLLNNVSYILESKGDDLIYDLVETNNDRLEVIFSNEKYNIYKIIETDSYSVDKKLVDSAYSFVTFLNAHPKGNKIFSKNTVINFKTDSEQVCIEFDNKISVIPCQDYDIKISGDYLHLKEMLETFSITEFIYRTNWFYSKDEIQFELVNTIELNTPNIPIPIDSVTLTDLNILVELNDNKLTVSKSNEVKGIQTNSKFVSRTMKWTLLNSRHTFPNTIFGFIYASVKEVI